MKRLAHELLESFRIAFAQLRAHKMRSLLTALGVIIGIVAVTMMGTAINGMNVKFNESLAMLGSDVLYVQKWPWSDVEDWWNYVNRPPIRPEMAARLNRIIQDTPNSLLQVAVPVMSHPQTVKRAGKEVDGVYTAGTTSDFRYILATDFEAGRYFTETEADDGRPVCILGNDVAHALFPGRDAIGQTVNIKDHPFRVIGVFVHQGDFLGLFSMDNQALVPLDAYRKYIGANDQTELRVKVRDKNRMTDAMGELRGAMRRVRGQLIGTRDNFTINQQEAFKKFLDPVELGISVAGLTVTSLALFVGCIGIMNILFVSVKERTKEIGTRKALGARRRTILLQFLIEACSVSLLGGVMGLTLTWGLSRLIALAVPTLPIQVPFLLVVIGFVVSIIAGVLSGIVPAWSASRLDPVEALRYE
ncbi:MAG TPA: ABC transporter permease [Opitutaceae bacterium]|jgi:putative ABC transport system permease protein